MKKSISKKYISVVICMYLLLILAACQKQSVWQEQYDLGMRYLNERNYEEAILAFMSAIEIDPRQADAYVYLTQAYLTQVTLKMLRLSARRGMKPLGTAD